MKNTINMIILTMGFSVCSFAQPNNLVQNGDFEDTLYCPSCCGDNISAMNYWFNPNGWSSDCFHFCSYTWSISLGNPFSASNKGVAAIYTHSGGFDFSDYIESGLSETLIAGKKYYFEMEVRATITYMASDGIGAYFSQDSLYDTTSGFFAGISPQIENPSGNIIKDSVNWTTVSGVFTATGGEKYITIGNFRTGANTQTSSGSVPSSNAYHFIDNVKLYEFIPPQDTLSNMYISPNFTTDFTTLYYTLKGYEKGSLSIYNSIGQVVYRRELDKENYQQVIDVTSFAPGMYMWQVHNDKMVCAKGKLEVVR